MIRILFLKIIYLNYCICLWGFSIMKIRRGAEPVLSMLSSIKLRNGE